MGEDGGEIPFTFDGIYDLLKVMLPDLYDTLAQAADVRTKYQAEATKDIVKK